MGTVPGRPTPACCPLLRSLAWQVVAGDVAYVDVDGAGDVVVRNKALVAQPSEIVYSSA